MLSHQVWALRDINALEQLGTALTLCPGPSLSPWAVSGRCWAPAQPQAVLAVHPLPQAQVMDLLPRWTCLGIAGWCLTWIAFTGSHLDLWCVL